MSKLVLFMPDGTTLDVPLARERTTIGRRADNDICLPNLAVSGEHAVGRDHPCRLVSRGSGQHQRHAGQRQGNRQAFPARSRPDRHRPPQAHLLRRRRRDDDLGDRRPGAHQRPRLRRARRVGKAFRARAGSAGSVAGGAGGPPQAARRRTRQPPRRPAQAAGGAAAAVDSSPPVEAPTRHGATAIGASAPPAAPASIKVLSGVNAGVSIPLLKAETTIGRPGVQVASIVQTGTLFRLKPLEGAGAPRDQRPAH